MIPKMSLQKIKKSERSTVTQKLAERKKPRNLQRNFQPTQLQSKSAESNRKKSKIRKKSLCLSQVIKKLIQYHSYHSRKSAFSKQKEKTRDTEAAKKFEMRMMP